MNEVTKMPAKRLVQPMMFDRPGSMVNWLRTEVDRFFDDFGGGRSAFGFSPAAPVPAIEFAEGEKDYSITAELPGMDESDIEVSIADGVLTLKGEKKEEQERKEKGLRLSERRYGSFERRFALPADANEQTVSATFKKGVLSVTIPKDDKVQEHSRKIEIH
jgi:HSP20 family protein